MKETRERNLGKLMTHFNFNAAGAALFFILGYLMRDLKFYCEGEL